MIILVSWGSTCIIKRKEQKFIVQKLRDKKKNYRHKRKTWVNIN